MYESSYQPAPYLLDLGRGHADDLGGKIPHQQALERTCADVRWQRDIAQTLETIFGFDSRRDETIGGDFPVQSVRERNLFRNGDVEMIDRHAHDSEPVSHGLLSNLHPSTG